MAKARSPWRALRPVLLAGAATITWLTLSSSPAMAESSTDPGSLLGGAGSSLSAVSVPLTETVAPLTPAAGSTAGTADELVAAVPVVDTVVTAGTLPAAVAPVAVVADNATAAVIETVVPPLASALPVVAPVLQSVVELAETAAPALPTALAPDPAEEPAAASPTEAATGIAAAQVTAADDTADAFAALAGISPRPQDSAATLAMTQSAASGSPWAGDPSSPPVPAGPVSGAGSGASAAGLQTGAAWLDDFGLYLTVPGSSPFPASSEHAPPPVSYDPGSSPD